MAYGRIRSFRVLDCLFRVALGTLWCSNSLRHRNLDDSRRPRTRVLKLTGIIIRFLRTSMHSSPFRAGRMLICHLLNVFDLSDLWCNSWAQPFAPLDWRRNKSWTSSLGELFTSACRKLPEIDTSNNRFRSKDQSPALCGHPRNGVRRQYATSHWIFSQTLVYILFA
jgi:hypothetical protein